MSRAGSALASPGVAAALASAALFGASTPFAKALLGEVSPWLLAGLLYLGSGIGLGALRLLRLAPAEAPLRRRDLPRLALVILAGGVAGPLLLMLGLAQISAAGAALLLNLEGVFTVCIAWVVFRENVDLRVGLGAAAILAGAALISWEGGGLVLGLGALAVAGACLAWAIDNNLTRSLSSADPVEVALAKGLAAGAINTSIALGQGSAWPPLSSVLAAGVVGLLGYGVSLALFVRALRDLGAARTGAYFSLAPFIGAGIAVFGFGEPLSPRFLAAALLMGLGTYLHLAERHEHEHEHEPITHEHAHRHDEHHRHEHEPGTPEGEPHTHRHSHGRLRHKHPHYPDIHHRHTH